MYKAATNERGVHFDAANKKRMCKAVNNERRVHFAAAN